MMTDDNNGDIEAATGPREVRSDRSRKRKIGFATLFFVVVVGLVIALGVTLGTRGGSTESSPNAAGGVPDAAGTDPEIVEDDEGAFQLFSRQWLLLRTSHGRTRTE
jgi:hypothetical protein